MEILGASNVSKVFGRRKGLFGRATGVQALKGVSVSVDEGDTLGIVGESGSGKTTLARILVGLDQPSTGEIRLREQPVDLARADRVRAIRRDVQLVLQDSTGTLNPRQTARQAVAFGPWARGEGRRRALARADESLDLVGLPPDTYGRRYPYQLSGGQRQRVNLARALVLRPSVLILDEPVSALDKSVEAQILNLLVDLGRKLKLTMVLISHDLAVVRYLCRRSMVMLDGAVVEEGASEQVFRSPRHDYTRALISALPAPPMTVYGTGAAAGTP